MNSKLPVFFFLTNSTLRIVGISGCTIDRQISLHLEDRFFFIFRSETSRQRSKNFGKCKPKFKQKLPDSFGRCLPFKLVKRIKWSGKKRDCEGKINSFCNSGCRFGREACKASQRPQRHLCTIHPLYSLEHLIQCFFSLHYLLPCIWVLYLPF